MEQTFSSNEQSKILVVEDAESLRDALVSLLEAKGYLVDSFSTAEDALTALAKSTYSCILADFKLPEKNGIELLIEARKISTKVPFIIMTAYGSVSIAVEAMRQGANDFLTKPFEHDQLCSVVADVISHRQITDRRLGSKTRRQRQFISHDPALKILLEQARKVARVDTSVLILGESGTGKELLARYIHEHSLRNNEPFVAVNCAALPSELLESEFFGHEQGAYTGATQRRIGVFEYASKGTIFLDEIGDMSAVLQVKLLRALQENEIKRIGSNKTVKVNPRIIAATNQEIEAALETHSMRDDFYFRVAVVTLTIPPLRERPEDIEVLTDYYLDYFCNTFCRTKPTLHQDTVRALKTYHWPGNTRELENVIERAVILSATEILPQHLGIRLDLEAIEDSCVTLQEIAARASKKAEVEIIAKTLKRTQGNKSKAARLLGVSYKTLLSKVKEYELEPHSNGLDDTHNSLPERADTLL